MISQNKMIYNMSFRVVGMYNCQLDNTKKYYLVFNIMLNFKWLTLEELIWYKSKL